MPDYSLSRLGVTGVALGALLLVGTGCPSTRSTFAGGHHQVAVAPAIRVPDRPALARCSATAGQAVVAPRQELAWSVETADRLPHRVSHGQAVVGPDGSLVVGPYGTVLVAGLTVDQA